MSQMVLLIFSEVNIWVEMKSIMFYNVTVAIMLYKTYDRYFIWPQIIVWGNIAFVPYVSIWELPAFQVLTQLHFSSLYKHNALVSCNLTVYGSPPTALSHYWL